MIRARAIELTLVVLVAAVSSATLAQPQYEGRKKCSSCHRSQYQSWNDTAHGKALESLKPGVKAQAKGKAKLDPQKDYTQDRDCVGCHVTGYAQEGGYDPKDASKFLAGVGCESCHGPGSEYRLVHRKAGQVFEKTGKAASRQSLVEAGQDLEFEERCNACHLNYAGSPWKGAKKPYTPFTPKVDKQYIFHFERAVQDDKAMHRHFKLDGTFTGPPTFRFHEEFQAKAKPGEKAGAEE
jgi:hypothetical protein